GTAWHRACELQSLQQPAGCGPPAGGIGKSNVFFGLGPGVFMSVERFDPESQPLVEVSEAARAHFKRQLQADSKARAVRLSIKESGCTGYMYVLDLVPEAQGEDISLALDEGVTLLLDASSVPVLRGTQIDYVAEGVN